MLSTVTLDDHTGTPVTIHIDSTTSKWFASAATGLIGGVVSAPRQNRFVRPQAHGAVNRTKYSDGSSISLSCEVQGTSIEDALTQFRTISAVCQQTLDYAPALLKWTEGVTGLQCQRLVTLDGPIDPPVSDGVAKLTFQLQFFAEDPRAYTQTQTSLGPVNVSTTMLANGTFAGDTVGNAPANWSVASGTYTTALVEASSLGTWTKTLQLAISSLANGASASFISSRFTVAASTDYAVAFIASGGLGGVALSLGVNFYDGTGTLIAASSGDLDSVTQLPGGVGVHYGVLAGRVTSPSNAATAAVYIKYTNNTGSAGGPNCSFWGVTFGPTPILTVANAGTRDTPLVLVTTFPSGSLTISGGGFNIALTNTRWLLSSSSDTATIDTGQRTVTSVVSGNLLNNLTAASAVWGNMPYGSTSVAVLGLIIGSSVSATFRSAY